MNKEYLKENNLYEAHKQFMRLCEWSFVSRNVMEDDDEEQNANMGGDMNQQDQMQGGDMPMGDDPMMGGEGMGDMPPMDDPMMGGEDMGEDEEVIDVEELTDAQEKMNSKVNVVGRNLGDVDDKIETLMQSLSKMEQMINNNNAEIAAFKQEFEKRNPTQTEKLNLRSLDSYPFNVNPKEYWEEKGIDPSSNYSGEANNDKSTTQEFVITNSDVDQFDNKTIEDSFNIDDDLQQSIEKIFNLK